MGQGVQPLRVTAVSAVTAVCSAALHDAACPASMLHHVF